MARLHEHQGKTILARHGIAVPRFEVARSPDEAGDAARRLGGAVVVKIQAWATGRKAIGGVGMAGSPEEAAVLAKRMLGMKVGNFVVEEVLVEERLDIRRELFLSLSIDDAARAPVMLLSFDGGSGIEDRAGGVATIPVHVIDGLDEQALAEALRRSDLAPDLHGPVMDVARAVVATARSIEARSIEINPLVVVAGADGRPALVAADCRMTVDDYAVFRHPELGIDIARELDHPPTRLERIAYHVEESDHRGTFYFAMLPHEPSDPRLIGFHGAGGGGSMMSMDAVTREGFPLANFCDTSGNPSSAKVYAAARIILTQPGLIGYFGSGSGVASQEQFWSAYGIAKAFNEVRLSIPAVVRLGGNGEERAIDILDRACAALPATVEGYGKDDTPAACAARFATLTSRGVTPSSGFRRHVPAFARRGSGAAEHVFERGILWIDLERCTPEVTALVVRHAGGVLREENGRPVPAVTASELNTRDSELIACEIECMMAGHPVVFVDLPVPGLDVPHPAPALGGEAA